MRFRSGQGNVLGFHSGSPLGPTCAAGCFVFVGDHLPAGREAQGRSQSPCRLGTEVPTLGRDASTAWNRTAVSWVRPFTPSHHGLRTTPGTLLHQVPLWFPLQDLTCLES